MPGQVLDLRLARWRRSAAFCDAHSVSFCHGTRNQLVERRRRSTPRCSPGTRRSSCSFSKARSLGTKPAATGHRTARGRLCSGYLASGTLTSAPSHRKGRMSHQKRSKIGRSIYQSTGRLPRRMPQIYRDLRVFRSTFDVSGLLSTAIYG